MIEKLKDLPRGIDGVRAIGKISKEDYERVFVPLLDEARRQGRRLRFLYQFGLDFESFTAGAAWEDAKIGLHSMRLFDGGAVVTNDSALADRVKRLRNGGQTDRYHHQDAGMNSRLDEMQAG